MEALVFRMRYQNLNSNKKKIFVKILEIFTFLQLVFNRFSVGILKEGFPKFEPQYRVLIVFNQSLIMPLVLS